MPEVLVANAGLTVVVAFWAAVVVAALPGEIVQDSWLALASGREVAQHGLPHTDSLTVWTLGRTWTDQQWLGQVFYYALAVAGGIRAVMLVHSLVLVGAVGVGVSAARRLGASAASCTVVAFATLLVAPWGMKMRTQDLGELLFVVLLALLALDARRPSARVYLAVPLLVVWANVHGSVLMGAFLVLVRAATLAVGEAADRRRAAALTVVALAAPLASPYNLALVGYYRHLLLNPLLHSVINEWGPTSPDLQTVPFYLLAFATVWALARHGGRLTLFARLALLVTLVGALTSIRNIVWFGLCALVLLPGLLDPWLANVRFRVLGRLAPVAPLVAGATLLTAGAFAATRSDGWLTQEWPVAQAPKIAALAERQRPVRVFADDRYADWLLWTEPRLRGHVAYDVRFELPTNRQIRLLFCYRNRIGDQWRAAVAGYPLIVFDPAQQHSVEAGLLAGGRFRRVSSSPRLVILRRAD
ncbi:MAG TPA: hypothetical protein VE088_02690 [Gaiellaceae bacterium]|nr:hypothetical protein [Gaiellaceae bacterium]